MRGCENFGIVCTEESWGFYFLHLVSAGLSTAAMQITSCVSHPQASHHSGKTNRTKSMEEEQTLSAQTLKN